MTIRMTLTALPGRPVRRTQTPRKPYFCFLTCSGCSSRRLNSPPEEVLRRRNSTEITEVITRFGARLEKLKLNIDRLPKKGQTAVNYALNMQTKLFRWRKDADCELDNNWYEWAACPYTLYHKTSLHTGSYRGAKVRAILRSLVETCKLEGISIVKYYTSFLSRCVAGCPTTISYFPQPLIIHLKPQN